MRTDIVGNNSPCAQTFWGRLALPHRHFWEISPCAHNTWAVWDKISHFSSILLFGKNKNYLKPPGKELKKITFFLRQFCKKRRNFSRTLAFHLQNIFLQIIVLSFLFMQKGKIKHYSTIPPHRMSHEQTPRYEYRENMTDKFFSVYLQSLQFIFCEISTKIGAFLCLINGTVLCVQ